MFEEFKKRHPRVRKDYPAVTFNKNGDFSFNCHAVKVIAGRGLRFCTLKMDNELRRIGFLFTKVETDNSYKVKGSNNSQAFIRGQLFCDNYGIKPFASQEVVPEEKPNGDILFITNPLP